MTLFTQTNEGFIVATDEQVVAEAITITATFMNRGPALTNPRAVIDFLSLRMRGLDYEIFTVIYVDNRHRVIKVEDLFRGTLDGSSVHTREVVKNTLLNSAAAVLFAHNHPSGVAEPSHADELITARLKDALSLIDVRVLDHIIIGNPGTFSFSENGLI